jgi:hypothetical protein
MVIKCGSQSGQRVGLEYTKKNKKVVHRAAVYHFDNVLAIEHQDSNIRKPLQTLSVPDFECLCTTLFCEPTFVLVYKLLTMRVDSSCRQRIWIGKPESATASATIVEETIGVSYRRQISL